MGWSEWIILMLSLSRCNAPGALHVTGWVLAWQTPRDTRDERRGQKWKWRSLLSEHITLFSNLFPGGPYTHFPPSLRCERCSLMWLSVVNIVTWVTWRVTLCVTSPRAPELSSGSSDKDHFSSGDVDRENVNTAGSLEIRLYRISFPASGHEMRGEEESSASEKSWIVLTTSYIFILTKYLPHDLCSNSTHKFSKKILFLDYNLTKDLEFQLPHSHPLPAMRGTLSFNCLICCWYKTPRPG